MTKKIMIIAGEFSGDRLGANLMAELKSQSNQLLEFVGLGGPKMAEQGLESAFDIEETNIMGLVEVLPRIPKLLKRINEMALLAEAEKIDALITIDAPDFCLRVAKKVKENQNVPCIHYVSPQVWAWRQGRVKKMAKYLDHVLALFPFEPKIYEKFDLPCTFVGHPLMEDIEPYTPEVRDVHPNPQKPVLSLLPGSRYSVMTKLFPVMMDAVEILRKKGYLGEIIVPIAQKEHENFLLDLHPAARTVDFVQEEERFKPLCTATAALAASGTSNLEIAAIGLPMVVAYKMNNLTFSILNKLVNVPYISPVNWVAGKMVIPECVQNECTAAQLAEKVWPLLSESTARHAQVTSLNEVRAHLRGTSHPSGEAAKVVLEYLK